MLDELNERDASVSDLEGTLQNAYCSDALGRECNHEEQFDGQFEEKHTLMAIQAI